MVHAPSFGYIVEFLFAAALVGWLAERGRTAPRCSGHHGRRQPGHRLRAAVPDGHPGRRPGQGAGAGDRSWPGTPSRSCWPPGSPAPGRWSGAKGVGGRCRSRSCCGWTGAPPCHRGQPRHRQAGRPDPGRRRGQGGAGRPLGQDWARSPPRPAGPAPPRRGRRHRRPRRGGRGGGRAAAVEATGRLDVLVNVAGSRPFTACGRHQGRGAGTR